MIDGRINGLNREERQEMHQRAHLKTVEWWKKNGFLPMEESVNERSN